MSSINQATVFYFINLLVTIINYNKGENKTKKKNGKTKNGGILMQFLVKYL